MTEVTKITAAPVAKWIKDNYWMVLFTVLFASAAFSLIGNAADHKNQVQEISKQNAACIYLESSDLGDGQHYMICDGQIVLKRLSDALPVATPEQQLEEVVPTNATETPPAK